ncbi:MAG: arginine--tRNA ligase [bacterium]
MKLHALRESLARELQKKFQLPEADLPAPVFLPPPPRFNADISVPWAMAAAKKLKKSPAETAEKTAETASQLEGVASAVFQPPGFVNIKLADSSLLTVLGNIISDPSEFARISPKPEGKILLEFVSANPTGPLHMASGRGATLGDSLVRIMRFLGYDVSAEYYINDSGRQVDLLGKSLKARYEATEPPEDGYMGEYLIELAEKLPAGLKWKDKEFSDFAITEILKDHKTDMTDFGVAFDRWFKESELQASDSIRHSLKKLKSMSKTYEKDGAVWFGSSVEQSKEGKDDKDRVLVRQDGRPTYFLSDIAYHLNKFERGFARLIDIWGADHHGYVPRMKAAVEALGQPADSFTVIIHQMVFLIKGGQAVKMSKRAGDFVSLKELMEEVGKDACRFFFAMRTPDSHLNFDLDLATKQSSENPVFYVQYVHARICSIFKNAGEKGFGHESSLSAKPASLAPEERAILVKLLWFQETLEACVRDLSPHHLTNYLLELAGLFHPFYDRCKVLDDANPERSSFRLRLCEGVRLVIASGLGLIGVCVPESM